MFKRIALLAILTGTAALASADTISGNMTWINGTSVGNITAAASAQIITLKVGSNTTAIPNIMVLGVPGTVYPSSTAFEVLAAGSQPFTASYSALSLIATVPVLSSEPTAARTVPMSSTGVLTDGVAFPSATYDILDLLYPSFTIGSYSFLNGLTMSMNTELKSFSLTLPTLSTQTLGGVSFPTGSIPINSFVFTASGTTQLDLQGKSTSSGVRVAGIQVLGSGESFTNTTLAIMSGSTP